MIAALKKFIKRFVRKTDRWSIGIYVGDSPYHFWPAKNVRNPVLTIKDVTDRKAKVIADPFFVNEQGIWYMFFEVLDRTTQKGEIGFAESLDGFRWKYQSIVLREPFHLSYPYIFKYENEFYMIPESHKKKSIRLYKAVDFPYKWEFISDLLTGSDFIDSSVFCYENKWWLFTCPTTESNLLKLYYASELKGPWSEHPASPIIVNNPHIARCGGRVLIHKNKIIRYTQDDYPNYGTCLNAFEITKLTMTDYEEKEYQANPILKTNQEGWNKDGIHNIDPHFLGEGQWIACVDGNARYFEIKRIQE